MSTLFDPRPLGQSPSLPGMAQGAPRTFELVPHGPDVSLQAATPLAQNGGELVGAIVGGGVCTWLAQPHGHLVLMMWPPGLPCSV